MEAGYKLIDALWLSRTYPGTFKVPSARTIALLEPGDFVKMFFEDQMMPDFPERLWVQVDKYDLNYGGVGRIANLPYCINALYGDTIEFQPKHILDVMQRYQYDAKIRGDEDDGTTTSEGQIVMFTKPQLALTAKRVTPEE